MCIRDSPLLLPHSGSSPGIHTVPLCDCGAFPEVLLFVLVKRVREGVNTFYCRGECYPTWEWREAITLEPQQLRMCIVDIHSVAFCHDVPHLHSCSVPIGYALPIYTFTYTRCVQMYMIVMLIRIRARKRVHA